MGSKDPAPLGLKKQVIEQSGWKGGMHATFVGGGGGGPSAVRIISLCACTL